MKKLLIATLMVGVLTAPGLGFTQHAAATEEISKLVSQFSWESFGMDCDVLPHICSQGEVATRLRKIGKPGTNALLQVLEDKDKGVAAHVILTEIWEPKNAKGRMRFAPDSFLFDYNELEWAQVFDEHGSKMEIKPDSLSKTAAVWRQKLSKYQSDAPANPSQ